MILWKGFALAPGVFFVALVALIAAFSTRGGGMFGFSLVMKGGAFLVGLVWGTVQMGYGRLGKVATAHLRRILSWI